MNISRKCVGDFGEYLAYLHIINMKHEVLAFNYRSLYGEIDIVSCENNKIHFIEVKTVLVSNVSRETSIFAEEHVTHEKISKIYKTAEVFLDEFGSSGDSGQVDVVGIYIDREFYKNQTNKSIIDPIEGVDYRIVYIENVF